MSDATDELRRLLDERGVEHYDHENGEPLRDLSEAGPDPATSWCMGDASVCAVPNNKGTFDIWIDHATSEQAIAATLGPGTLTADDVRLLESENAKLRELVRGLRWCNDKSWNNGACDQCPISGRAVGRCDRLVRELGIEVDG